MDPGADFDREEKRRLEADRKSYLRKMDQLIDALNKHAGACQKLSRQLEAHGVYDPSAPPQPQAGLLNPRNAPGTGGSEALVILTRHLTRAFPPRELRGMVEDLFDGLSGQGRKRRR